MFGGFPFSETSLDCQPEQMLSLRLDLEKMNPSLSEYFSIQTRDDFPRLVCIKAFDGSVPLSINIWGRICKDAEPFRDKPVNVFLFPACNCNTQDEDGDCAHPHVFISKGCIASLISFDSDLSPNCKLEFEINSHQERKRFGDFQFVLPGKTLF